MSRLRTIANQRHRIFTILSRHTWLRSGIRCRGCGEYIPPGGRCPNLRTSMAAVFGRFPR